MQEAHDGRKLMIPNLPAGFVECFMWIESNSPVWHVVPGQIDTREWRRLQTQA